jgi:hypothetical protein
LWLDHRNHSKGVVRPINLEALDVLSPLRCPCVLVFVTRTAQVKPPWMASWLNHKYPEHLTSEIIRKLSASHRDNIQHIFQLATGLYSKDLVHSECQSDPTLFFWFCNIRSDEIGFDPEAFLAMAVDKETGHITWAGFPFKLKWSDTGRIESITSYFGDVAFLKEHQVINKNFKIPNICDLVRAVAKYEETEHPLLSLFGPDTQTRSHVQDKKGDNTRETLQKAIQAKNKAEIEVRRRLGGTAGADLIASESLASRDVKKRKAEVARQAAAASKASRVQTLDLSDVQMTG